MPRVLDFLPALLHQPAQLIDGFRVEAKIIRYIYLRQKPEFRVGTVLHYMDVDRLTRIALVRIKMETKSILSKDDWHPLSKPASSA